MGTRCETIVCQHNYTSPTEFKTEELFRFYRHWDGYPEGHGKDIAAAMLAAEHRYKDSLNNRNWCQKLFAFLFSANADMEVEPPDAMEWGDLDYIYVIIGNYDGHGGKHGIDHMPVHLAVFRSGWDESYSETLGKEPLFKGTATEYLDWLEERKG